MSKLELPVDGSIWILCGISFVIVCKMYNTILAGEDDVISDLVIAKTLIMAVMSVSFGSYIYNMYNSYTPSFTSMPITTKPSEEPVVLHSALRTPRITRLVNSV